MSASNSTKGKATRKNSKIHKITTTGSRITNKETKVVLQTTFHSSVHNNNNVSQKKRPRPRGFTSPNVTLVTQDGKIKYFSCNFCHRKCRSNLECERHVRMHTGEKPFKCSACPASFVLKTRLQCHEKRVHTTEQQDEHPLNFDPGNSKTRATVKIRRDGVTDPNVTRLFIDGNYFYSCNFCDKKFRHNMDCERHVRSHTGEKPYSCSYCNKAFSIRHAVTLHERIHTGEKPYACQGHGCGLRFRTGADLHSHLRCKMYAACKAHYISNGLKAKLS